MDKPIVWGVLFIAYLVPFCSWAIYKQVKAGHDDFAVNAQTLVPAGGLLALCGVWGLGLPPGFGVIAWAAIVATVLYVLRRGRRRTAE